MASQNRGFFELLSAWLASLIAGLNPFAAGDEDASVQGTKDQPSEPAPERPRDNAPAEPGVPGASGLERVVEGGRITARFLSTGSPAWTNQWKGVFLNIGGVVVSMHGKHGGLDISAAQGSKVYAPYAMNVIKIGHYDDVDSNGEHCCRYGTYIIGMLDSDPTVQYYSGHLQNVKISGLGHVNAGKQLGETNVFNHTHLQLRRATVLLDPETYLAGH